VTFGHQRTFEVSYGCNILDRSVLITITIITFLSTVTILFHNDNFIQKGLKSTLIHL